MLTNNRTTCLNDYWKVIVPKAVEKSSTPCYIFSWKFVQDALKELSCLNTGLPVRHWLSFKTQPVRPLVRAWKKTGRGIEVVSKFELQAALSEGYNPDLILINGVAKHDWLSEIKIEGLRINFDSLLEISNLKEHAKDYNWHVGIRFHVKEEYDPDEPIYGGQFGIEKEGALTAVSNIKKSGLDVESVHFHLRSNVYPLEAYKNALIEISDICRYADITPLFINCGGGLSVVGERSYPSQNQSQPTDFGYLSEVFSIIPSLFPGAKEIWLENGRFITSRMGVLVIKVLDIKERGDSRYLICDGGRTNHALISDWELHDIFTIPERKGEKHLTTVCGPTCMAFDRIIREKLPNDIQVGDLIVWKNAGAYHIPWETRFSHGLAPVIWCGENGSIEIARERESFKHWWGQWL